MITLILIVIAIFILVYQFSTYSDKLEELEEENQILRTENYSLKRVMRENDLIPEEYVKEDTKK